MFYVITTKSPLQSLILHDQFSSNALFRLMFVKIVTS